MCNWLKMRCINYGCGLVVGFDLQATASNLREYRIGSQRAIALSSGLSDLLFFLLLGLLVYGLPQFRTVSAKLLSGYVITMSYLMRPIGNLLAILPSLSQAGVALRKIDASVAETPRSVSGAELHSAKLPC
jgi:ABC-type siderophore export system fused ATPase/permease subunit